MRHLKATAHAAPCPAKEMELAPEGPLVKDDKMISPWMPRVRLDAS